MTFRQALADAAEKLISADILFCDTPMLDASVLLSYAADITREKLFASYPDELPPDVETRFNGLIEKRISGLPVSYIRNLKEFYGRDFYVDESVLVPRPDTEVLVEKALQLLDNQTKTGQTGNAVLDLCTGSSCIAVSLKLERPQLILSASDISEAALKTARRNAENLGADINFIKSSLFDAISGKFDMIVTNPPYLTTEETNSMMSTGWPEPDLALDGGSDGLDLIRIIVKTALDYLNDNSYLLIEAGPQQAEDVAELLKRAGFTDIEITKDLAGRNRLTSGRKSGNNSHKI